MINAVLADFSATEKLGSGAEEAKIVKRLNYWDTSLAARAIHRRRDHYEGVVNVHGIRIFPVEECPEIAVSIAGPDRALRQRRALYKGELIDLLIAASICDYIMPVTLK